MNNSNKNRSKFSAIIFVSLVLATCINFIISFFEPIFILNENQLLYLFSSMGQIIGGVFGLTLTAYVFFADKFKESTKEDDTYYDATTALLNRYFRILIAIAVSCGMTILSCVVGIITLHNLTTTYPLIINESVFLFIISLISILAFGAMLLDPAKLDKEITNMKNKAKEFYKTANLSVPGDFMDFLKSYNLLENIIFEFASECMKRQSNYHYGYKPQIIQSLKVLGHNEIINGSLQNEINELRMYRNALVHGVDFSVPKELCNRTSKIYNALQKAFVIYKDYGRNSKEWEKAINEVYDLTR